jgi:hypothetical protein
MTHSLQGGYSHGKLNGFTALGKAIGTPYSTDKDCAYVTEHPVLKAHGAACGQKSASGTLGAHFVLSKRYSNADLIMMQNNNIPDAHFMHTMCRLCKTCYMVGGYPPKSQLHLTNSQSVHYVCQMQTLQTLCRLCRLGATKPLFDPF